MRSGILQTADELLESLSDQPDAGRWTELMEGRPMRLEPPDDMHGTIVLNISKALATATHAADALIGYPCFDQPLLVKQDPDWLLKPAVSYFTDGPFFTEMDERYSTTVPALIFEVASTNDRRRQMAARLQAYLEWGVRTVWVADPVEKIVHVHNTTERSRQLADWQTLSGEPVVPNLRLQVKEIFESPSWASDAGN